MTVCAMLQDIQTSALANRAALDAGYRSMAKGKRSSWNADDFAFAARARRVALELLTKQSFYAKSA